MAEPLFWPPHAYVPGQTARHREGYFDEICDSVRPDAAILQTQAWIAGLAYLEAGYFWECHEVLEPVWMSLPRASPERARVQALIQLANANLKLHMSRPRAVLRLCDLVLALLADAPDWVLGTSTAQLRAEVETLSARVNNMH